MALTEWSTFVAANADKALQMEPMFLVAKGNADDNFYLVECDPITGVLLTSSGGGGGGSGTVTSVNASGGTTGFSFTGGPVTTSGTLTLTVSNAATVRSAIGAGTGNGSVTSVAVDATLTGGTITTTGTLGINLNNANTWTAVQTFSAQTIISANGAASTSPLALTGTIFTGGSATTNFPALLIQPTGTTAVTSFSTSGVGMAMNMPSGFTGNFMSMHVNGAASAFKVTSASILSLGALTINPANGATTFGQTFSINIVTSNGVTIQSGSSDSVGIRNGTNFPRLAFVNGSGSLDAYISRKAAASLQMGLPDAASPTAQTFNCQSVVTGTSNTNGVNWTFAGSQGTGTGTGGSLLWQVAPAGSSGSTPNTLVTAMTLDSTFLMTHVDAFNFAFGTTTGSKLATSSSQKIGVWNATPIVQPTTAIAAATFAANTSGILNDTATWDGYTMGQVVKALRNTGWLA